MRFQGSGENGRTCRAAAVCEVGLRAPVPRRISCVVIILSREGDTRQTRCMGQGRKESRPTEWRGGVESEVAGRIKLERVNLKLAPRRSAPSGLGRASCKQPWTPTASRTRTIMIVPNTDLQCTGARDSRLHVYAVRKPRAAAGEWQASQGAARWWRLRSCGPAVLQACWRSHYFLS